MPVYKLLEEMPYEELLCWFSYLDSRPIDWRDDDRTFKFLQTQGYKGKPWEAFMSLKSIYQPSKPIASDNRINIGNLKSSLLFHKMLSAKKGDLLDFNEIEGNASITE